MNKGDITFKIHNQLLSYHLLLLILLLVGKAFGLLGAANLGLGIEVDTYESANVHSRSKYPPRTNEQRLKNGTHMAGWINF